MNTVGERPSASQPATTSSQGCQPAALIRMEVNSTYIGQTITLKFTGTEVSGGNTSFFEDSNALNVK